MGLRGIGARTRQDRAADAKKLRKRLPWNKKGLSRAERVISFIEDLTVTSGALAGTKMRVRPWQRSFIERVYWEDEEGSRVVRTAVLSMGRKNGKTQLAAALALCHLSGPEAESRGEVYSCANDRFQAGKIFQEMVALINKHPELNDRLNIIRFRKEIEDMENGSIYVALSAEVTTKMGLNPSFVVYDELGQAPKRDLYDAMDSAMGARVDPLMLVISTQAADDVAPMSQLIDYGLKVQAGDFEDTTFHMALYQTPQDVDIYSSDGWKMANPALGDFRSLEDVERLASQAKNLPSKEAAFRNLILNQRVAAEQRFIHRNEWEACSEPPNIPARARVFAALDLGGTRDLSALVLIHCDADGIFHVQPTFWLPGDIRARAEEDRMPYDLWQKQGYLISIGTTTDPEIVARHIAELSGQYQIQTLAYDRWRINDLKRELDAIGCNVTLLEHGQGYKDMGPAIDCLERIIAQKRLRHGGHPVMNMCAHNAVVTRDPTNARKLDKVRSIGRIDGLVALAMCFTPALLRNQTAPEYKILII